MDKRLIYRPGPTTHLGTLAMHCPASHEIRQQLLQFDEELRRWLGITPYVSLMRRGWLSAGVKISYLVPGGHRTQRIWLMNQLGHRLQHAFVLRLTNQPSAARRW